MKILGLNINHPDSSACLIVDGKILFAVEEERYSRVKHHSGFPIKAIEECLLNGKLNINEVDFVTLNTNFYSNFFEKIKFSIKNFRSIKKLKKLSLKKKNYRNFKKKF